MSYPVGYQAGAENFWVCGHVMLGPKVGVGRLVVCAFVEGSLETSIGLCSMLVLVYPFQSRALPTLIYLVPEGKN